MYGDDHNHRDNNHDSAISHHDNDYDGLNNWHGSDDFDSNKKNSDNEAADDSIGIPRKYEKLSNGGFEFLFWVGKNIYRN